MLRVGPFLSENKPLRRDAALLRQVSQSIVDLAGTLKKPKYAVRHGRQNRHPTRQHFGNELLRSVKTAIHERVVRQVFLFPGRAFGNKPLSIIGLITWQAENFLGVEYFIILWNYLLVSNYIMMIRGTHCSRKAKPVHRYRRWPQGKEMGSCIFGITVEIHNDINLVIRNFLCSLFIASGCG